jgi:hypothetical protein
MLKCNYLMLCLMGGFGVYLFWGFNEGGVLRRCVGCGGFVVVEPSRGVNELSGEECKDLGSALKPWIPRTVGILNEVSGEVGDEDGAV